MKEAHTNLLIKCGIITNVKRNVPIRSK